MTDIDVNTWIFIGISIVFFIWTAFWGLVPPVLSIGFALYMQKKGIEAYVMRADKKGKDLEKKLKKGLIKLVTEEIWKKENMKPLRKAFLTTIKGWYGNVMRSEQEAMEQMISEGVELSPGQKIKHMINQKIGEKYGISFDDIQQVLAPGEGKKPPKELIDV